MKPALDLNCDLGEEVIGHDTELALLGLVTSVSIACGGHAGSVATMTDLARECGIRGVHIGAHPSFPDRANFGRVAMRLPLDVLEASIAGQIRALIDAAKPWRVRHVKPHGALYHAANTDPAIAEVIAMACQSVDADLVLIAQADSMPLKAWRTRGLKVAAEAFADRRYEPDGTLRSRALSGALIEDPQAAAEQARRIARGRPIETSGGHPRTIAAETICIHSDTPGSLEIARAVRTALEEA